MAQGSVPLYVLVLNGRTVRHHCAGIAHGSTGAVAIDEAVRSWIDPPDPPAPPRAFPPNDSFERSDAQSPLVRPKTIFRSQELQPSQSRFRRSPPFFKGRVVPFGRRISPRYVTY